MSSIITNSAVIQNLANELIKPRQLNYSQDCIGYYISDDSVTVEHISDIKNSYGNRLKCTLIKHQLDYYHQRNMQSYEQFQQWKINSKCIIFLHGLGSTRLEAFPLTQTLPPQYCLFTFDFSGSGKSHGDYITYGLKQGQDIENVIQYLYERRGMRQFVLWGRSMGAVACLLYMKQLKEKAQSSSFYASRLQQIKTVVLDSPFSNFEEITKYIAIKKVSVPNFIIDMVIHFVKDNFKTLLYDEKSKKSFNPFQINFTQDFDISTPAIFLYSLTDDVVPKQHSQKIISHYKAQFQKIIMQDFPHNQNRPRDILERVYETLRKFQKKSLLRKRKNSNHKFMRNGSLNMKDFGHKNRGISVCTRSKEKNKQFIQEQTDRLYSKFRTMKVEPLLKSSPRSPRRLSNRKRKEEERCVVTQLFDPNEILKKKLLGKSQTAQTIFKRKNHTQYYKKGQAQPILHNTRYL